MHASGIQHRKRTGRSHESHSYLFGNINRMKLTIGGLSKIEGWRALILAERERDGERVYVGGEKERRRGLKQKKETLARRHHPCLGRTLEADREGTNVNWLWAPAEMSSQVLANSR